MRWPGHAVQVFRGTDAYVAGGAGLLHPLVSVQVVLFVVHGVGGLSTPRPRHPLQDPGQGWGVGAYAALLTALSLRGPAPAVPTARTRK